jgi:hypothetical protein
MVIQPCPAAQADRWSKSLKWWTRSQRIRTFSEIPIEAAILDTEAPPVYQQIAPKAVQLQQLGMSDSAIAKRLKITDKTITKAIAWFWRVENRP